MFPFSLNPFKTDTLSRKDWLKLYPRSNTKHNASKRGYQHKHRMSRGQRSHLAFMSRVDAQP